MQEVWMLTIKSNDSEERENLIFITEELAINWALKLMKNWYDIDPTDKLFDIFKTKGQFSTEKTLFYIEEKPVYSK